MSKLSEAGWRLPTPHELLGVVVVVASAMDMMDYFPAGTQGAKLCALVALVAAMTGIASASKRLPTRVREKLEAYESQEGGVQPATEVKS